MFIVYSLIILFLSVFLLLKTKNLVLTFFSTSLGIFLYYMIGYKIQINLIFSQLDILQIVNLIAVIACPIVLFILYKILKRTKVLNDWLQPVALVIPYNIQKIFLLFFIGQLFVDTQTNIFYYLILMLILTYSLKVSRLHGGLVIIFGLTYNLLIQSSSFISQAILNDLYAQTPNLYLSQIVFMIIILFSALLILVTIDKFNYRNDHVDEKFLVKNKQYFYLVSSIMITYVSLIMMLQLYFPIPIANSITSAVVIVIILLVSKYSFTRFDFVDFDDFYEKKDMSKPIISSYIVLFVLIVASFFVLNGNAIIGLLISLLLVSLTSRYYNINIYRSSFMNIDLIFITSIIIIFNINNLVIVESFLNNSNFNTNISYSLVSMLNTSTNEFVNIFLYLTQYVFLTFNQIGFMISETIPDSLELYISQINVLTTIFSFYIVIFIFKVLKVKKEDYSQFILVSMLFITVYLIFSTLFATIA